MKSGQTQTQNRKPSQPKRGRKKDTINIQTISTPTGICFEIEVIQKIKEDIQITFEIIPIIWVIYGSSDSNDIDITLLLPDHLFETLSRYDANFNVIACYFDRIGHEIIKSTYDNQMWKQSIDSYIINKNGLIKEMNTNICSYIEYDKTYVINGSYKGPVDEMHMAIVRTYAFHPQMFHKLLPDYVNGSPILENVHRSISSKILIALIDIINIIYSFSQFYPEPKNDEEWLQDMQICRKLVEIIFDKIVSIIETEALWFPNRSYGCDRHITYTNAIANNFNNILQLIFIRCYHSGNNIEKVISRQGDPFNTKFNFSYIKCAQRIITDKNINKEEKFKLLIELYDRRVKHEISPFSNIDPELIKKNFYTQNMITVPKLSEFIRSIGMISDLFSLIKLFPWNRINIQELKTKRNNHDNMKKITFQIGQAFALLQGYEQKSIGSIIDSKYMVFQKEDVAKLYPQLSKFVRREDYNQNDLDNLKKILDMFYESAFSFAIKNTVYENSDFHKLVLKMDNYTDVIFSTSTLWQREKLLPFDL
jgi:hypothetical protein